MEDRKEHARAALPRFDGSALAYLTPDLPGTGGKIKQRTEDFVVDEQPLYPPSGKGDHLYLYVEKRDRTTSDAVRRLAKAFRVSRGQIGYAGLKDKRAVARQMFSINLPDRTDQDRYVGRIRHTGMRTLWVSRHRNKLKRGHLAGNRFLIRVRDVGPQSQAIAQRVLDRLVDVGVPNYVGHQRFGYRGTNHEQGRLLLLGRWQEMLDLMLGGPHEIDFAKTRAGREAYDRGDMAQALQHWPRHLVHDRQALEALRQGKSAHDAVMSIDRQQRSFLISSLQSVMFNQTLDRRIRRRLFDQLVEGDLAWKHRSRAVFRVDRATAEVENAVGGRVRTLAVSPSGPMWGVEMPLANGVVGQWEHQVLTERGLCEADLIGGRHASADGQRRPMRTFLENPQVAYEHDEHGPYLRLEFGLPSGSYATVVLREIMKPDPVETSASQRHER